MQLVSTMFYDEEPRKHLFDENLIASKEVNPEWEEWERRQVKPEKPTVKYDNNDELIWIARKALQWEKYFEESQYYESHRLRWEGFKRVQDKNEYVESVCFINNGLKVVFWNELIRVFKESIHLDFIAPSISAQLFNLICKENKIELIDKK